MRTIMVTKRDIELGEPQDCFSCPIARAVRRTLRVKPAHAIMVEHEEVSILNNDKKVQARYILPRVATRFIIRFDNGKRVSSFSFKMKNENEVGRL